MSVQLLSRAPLGAVLRRRAPLIGSRLDPDAVRGCFSPVESRIHAGLAYGSLFEDERAYLRRRSIGKDAAMLARLLVARRFGARRGEGDADQRAFIVSSAVDRMTIGETLDWILRGADSATTRFAFFVHPHALNLAAFDGELRATLSRADKILPDGIGLRLAGRLLGTPIVHNVNGTDLLPDLCARAATDGRPLVLVGAAPGVAEACAERLRERYAGLSIPWVSDGFLDEESSRAVAARIAKTGPCIVLVGMGTPRQERWASTYLRDLPGVTVLTVGGLFDFYSGRIPRAPMAWRELGLEWLYRLKQEPRRLAKRYLVGNPLFLALAMMQRAGLRRGDASGAG